MRCTLIAVMVILLAAPGVARAEGALHLLNWRNYTSPELVAKFEKAHAVEVTLSEFDSMAEALGRIGAEGHGIDAMVAPAGDVAALIRAGKLARTRPDRMENFARVGAGWRDPDWDRGRRYSAPWAWGGLGIAVDGAVHEGEIDTLSILFDPPEALGGKISVVPDQAAVIGLALIHTGAAPCARSQAALDAAAVALLAAQAKWQVIDFGGAARLRRGEAAAALVWNDDARRARLGRETVRFAFPKEGFPLWMDSLVVLKGAANEKNAKLFQDFVMAPENAALISAFTGQANAIDGAAAFLPDDLQNAPEIAVPDGAADAGVFFPACPAGVIDAYDRLWNSLLQ